MKDNLDKKQDSLPGEPQKIFGFREIQVPGNGYEGGYLKKGVV